MNGSKIYLKNRLHKKCAENVLILRPSNMKMSLFLQNAFMMDLFLTYMLIFTSQDVN